VFGADAVSGVGDGPEQGVCDDPGRDANLPDGTFFHGVSGVKAETVTGTE